MKSSFNYVRTYRKRNALSTRELAALLGLRSGASVAKFERGERAASLWTAFALQVVFGVAPRELFPGLYETVEDAVMRRARSLHNTLEGRTDAASGVKRELLDDMPRRSLANTIEA